MLGRQYCCRAIGEIPIIRDIAEREELLAALPSGFVAGNTATVRGVIRQDPESQILFTRDADPVPEGNVTARIFQMPLWAFSAWFVEVQ